MTTTTAERRGAPRSRAFLKGLIVYSHGNMSVPCLVRDISASGARLKLASGIVVPNTFDLHFPDRNERRPARLVRVIGDEIGVEYTDIPHAAPAPAPVVPMTPPAASVEVTSAQTSEKSALVAELQARIAELEADNARMKTMLSRLGLE